MSGLQLSKFNSDLRAFLKVFMGMTSDNYPENMERMFIVNAPWIFTTVRDKYLVLAQGGSILGNG